MIDIRGGELINLITQPFDDVDMRCFSYAIKQITGDILDFADRIRTNAFIDGLPGYILDVLAQELRAPYYSSDMELEAKREIVKGSLKWQYQAGTKSAVEELLTAAFGGGEVTEWQDFTEPPYTPGTFDAVIDLPMTQTGAELFLSIIQSVKNERSHLRSMNALRSYEARQYEAVGVYTYTSYKIIVGEGLNG